MLQLFRSCLDMVSSGGPSRLPRSRHLGAFGTLLGPLPKRRLYLSSDAPQMLIVLSSLPLASDLASALHVTALTSLKAFKSVSMHKNNCFEKALGMMVVRNLPRVTGQCRLARASRRLPYLYGFVPASACYFCAAWAVNHRRDPAFSMKCVSTRSNSGRVRKIDFFF